MSTSSILNEFSSNETYYDAHYFNHLANSMLEANRLTFNFGRIFFPTFNYFKSGTNKVISK
jgi:hypothetical protein